MKIRITIVFFLLLVCFLPALDAVAQCPMCKASLEQARSSNQTEVGNSLNSGILYLLALPYSIAAVFGVVVYRKKQLRKRQAQ